MDVVEVVGLNVEPEREVLGVAVHVVVLLPVQAEGRKQG